MEWDVWLALVGLFLAGGLTPGPAVMLVVSSSLQYGFRPALLPSLGVSAANLVWIGLAASGAALIAAQFPQGFLALKIAGCCFIVWLAIGLVRNPPTGLGVREAVVPKRAALFGRGLGLQLANPNALVYFGALLPGYFDPARELWLQLLIMVVTITVTEMFGLAIYARLADSMARRFRSPRFSKGFAIVAAVTMAGSAIYAVIATS